MNATCLERDSYLSRKCQARFIWYWKQGKGFCMGHWIAFKRSREHKACFILPHWDFTSIFRSWPKAVKSLKEVWDTTERTRKCLATAWETEAVCVGFPILHWYVLQWQEHRSCRSLTGSPGRNYKGKRCWSLRSTRPLCRWYLLQWLPLDNRCHSPLMQIYWNGSRDHLTNYTVSSKYRV